MRKTFLSKNYSLEPISGSKNTLEQRAFFTSKVLKIEDVLYIGSNNINWSQSTDNTQGIRVESVNKIFNTYQVKLDNHTIAISPQQIDNFTKWEFTFNIREMIYQYIFAQLKSNRTFAGIDNSNTLNNDIDSAIKDYINYNVYPRINFFNIALYIVYYPLGVSEGILDSNNNPIIALQYDTKFRSDLLTPPQLAGETQEQYNIRVANYKKSIEVTNFSIINSIIILMSSGKNLKYY